MGQAQIPQTTYPVGPSIAGSTAFGKLTIQTGRVVVDGSLFTDPTTMVEAKIEFLYDKNGLWQHVVSATQQGSPTGWTTKHGSTFDAFDFQVAYTDGIVVRGARLTFTVEGSPATLGPVTLTWN